MKTNHASWQRLLRAACWLLILVELVFSNEASSQSVPPCELSSQSIIHVWSPNKEAVADVMIDTKCIRIGRVVWNGNIGRTNWLWSIEGSYQEGWLSDDGEYFVGCYEGLNFLPLSFTKDLTILSFFKQGTLMGSVRLDQLITDFSKLKRVGSQYRWSKYIGLNACGLIAGETIEGKKILFDITTGSAVELKTEGVLKEPGWKIYADIVRCYQFQYPSQYLLKESVVLHGDREGSPTGHVRLGRNGTRFIEVTYEDSTHFREFCAGKSFEEFAVERAKTMYSADGPSSSTHATEVARKHLFTNPNKLTVVEFYLTVVNESHSEDTDQPAIKQRIEGPVYAIRLCPAGKPRPYRVLFFRIRGESTDDLSQEEGRLKRIVDSVRLLIEDLTPRT